ncbi:MAG: hypothetical protein GF308_04670 [Candidatus Heimdallarchaeota archaeon]|nr:hypothetical protein [Candidatus Heimdallarchaeota archaeon]
MTKKMNPKIAAFALVLLSFLVASGVAINEGIAPGTGGFEDGAGTGPGG